MLTCVLPCTHDRRLRRSVQLPRNVLLTCRRSVRAGMHVECHRVFAARALRNYAALLLSSRDASASAQLGRCSQRGCDEFLPRMHTCWQRCEPVCALDCFTDPRVRTTETHSKSFAFHMPCSAVRPQVATLPFVPQAVYTESCDLMLPILGTFFCGRERWHP